MREIDQRLRDAGEISLDDYGVLITLVGQPEQRLRMSALGAQRLLTPERDHAGGDAARGARARAARAGSRGSVARRSRC